MPQADRLENEARRLDGESKQAQEKLPTYQELLDNAIEDTFPASDPIAVGGATRILEAHTTLRDAKDWTLRPGSDSALADPSAPRSSDAPELSEACDGFVESPMTLQATVEEAVQVPRGPCTIEQNEHRAVLRWTQDGKERCGSMAIEEYRDRLAAGVLRRGEPSKGELGRL